jgi:hypothetical protein
MRVVNEQMIQGAGNGQMEAHARELEQVLEERVTQVQSFCWPTPPFYRSDEQASKGARLCRVEYMDGTIAAGDLVTFMPSSGAVTLKPSPKGAAQAIDLARIRVIRQVDPIALSADASALRRIGAEASKVIEDKNFTIYFTASSSQGELVVG